VTHDWASEWIANLTATPGFRSFALHWGDHANPDVDAFRIEVGTQPGLFDEIHEVGDLRDLRLDNLTPGQAYYITPVGIDSETGRTSRAETIAVVAQGAAFDLSAPTAALTVTAGATATVALDLSTTSDPYPTSVSVYVDQVPDGRSGAGWRGRGSRSRRCHHSDNGRREPARGHHNDGDDGRRGL